MSRRTSFNVLMFVIGASISAGLVQAAEAEKKTEQGANAMPAPPWPAGDELGMANQLGSQTWRRCASYMTMPKAKVYELSYLRSNTMPTSPFSTPFVATPNPTKGIPGTVHAFNGEHYEAGAEPGQHRMRIVI